MMKKKNGFTLAEVLITLTIIGVVAMMTLPALMTNVQEQQAKTGLKKGINTLTEAAQMNQAVEGFGYADLRTEGGNLTADTMSEEQSLRGILINRAQIDTRLSDIGLDGVEQGAELSDYMDSNKNKIYNTNGLKSVVSFRDGSALIYNNTNTANYGAVATDTNTEVKDDGLPLGFVAVYDMNGLKGPNMISNCKGVLGGTTDNGVTDFAPSGDDCKDRSNRMIRDQFFVRLRGASVTPGSAAAKWVLDN